MVKIPIRIEHTYSKSGKHHRIALTLIINLKNGVVFPSHQNLKKCKGIYTMGFAYCGEYNLSRDNIAVYLYITYGLRGRNKGYIHVLIENGVEVLKLKYIDNKMRVVLGDVKYKDYALIALNNIYKVDEYAKH